MLAVTDSSLLWVVIIAASAWFALMSLRIITIELRHAMAWHDLKVQAHTLRLEQYARLRQMLNYAGRPSTAPTAGHPAETTVDRMSERDIIAESRPLRRAA
jgi:hypothetical protein